jgi:hemin uptake protein HemP
MNSERSDSKANVTRREPPLFAAGERTIRVVEDRIDSHDLFASTREIMISHRGDVYRLRLTARNKLILTK